MKQISRTKIWLLMLSFTVLLAACSAPRITDPAQYDLGPMRGQPAGPKALPAVSVAEVDAPLWLDSTKMVYRLSYANQQQLLSFAHSRWAMPPARLFEQRLKKRMAQSGSSVLSMTDGATSLPTLRIEVENFSQVFESATQSAAQVSVKTTLLRGRRLIAQKTFVRQSPAATADAAGGAAALTVASDEIIVDIMAWLAGTPLQ